MCVSLYLCKRACTDHGVQKELEMQPSSVLGASAPRVGEEIQRAVILSSDERINDVVRALRQLQELQGVLAQLEQLRSRNPVDDAQLAALERSTDVQMQRALALHVRTERLLGIYHEMISLLLLCCVFVVISLLERLRLCQTLP